MSWMRTSNLIWMHTMLWFSYTFKKLVEPRLVDIWSETWTWRDHVLVNGKGNAAIVSDRIVMKFGYLVVTQQAGNVDFMLIGQSWLAVSILNLTRMKVIVSNEGERIHISHWKCVWLNFPTCKFLICHCNMVISFFFSSHIILTYLHYFLIAPHILLLHTHWAAYPQIFGCQPSSVTHYWGVHVECEGREGHRRMKKPCQFCSVPNNFFSYSGIFLFLQWSFQYRSSSSLSFLVFTFMYVWVQTDKCTHWKIIS